MGRGAANCKVRRGPPGRGPPFSETRLKDIFLIVYLAFFQPLAPVKQCPIVPVMSREISLKINTATVGHYM